MLGATAPMAARGRTGVQQARGREVSQLRSQLEQMSGDGKQGRESFEIGEAKSGQGSGRSDEELKEAANKVESLLVNQLMKQMRDTVPDNELTGGGYGGEIFKTHLDRKYSELVAESSDLKLADQIYKQFTS